MAEEDHPTIPSGTGTLYSIGDLHVGHKLNREALALLSPHPNDGLILAGDMGESLDHLRQVFTAATACFAAVWWLPGNHELYTMPGATPAMRGHEKYLACVEVAREHGVRTPEDPYSRWDGIGGPAIIAPVFLLYDYSFRPDEISREGALEWARADRGTEATDEALLHPDPYHTRDQWCHALVERTAERLEEAAETGLPLVIANHWPLRQELVFLPFIPRFSLWCGTKLTDDWHKRFNAKVVINGHLHIRRTDWIDGVRFEEVSLGYPKQWEEAREKNGKDINDMLREILPGPDPVAERTTQWRKLG